MSFLFALEMPVVFCVQYAQYDIQQNIGAMFCEMTFLEIVFSVPLLNNNTNTEVIKFLVSLPLFYSVSTEIREAFY